MEQKKRGRKAGCRSKRRENVNLKTNFDVFDPFIDKFSLIKARRHKFEQNHERHKIFTPKKPFKEKEKSPTSDVAKSEVDISDLHVKYESKDISKVSKAEHVTIDLKRVGFNFIDGKVDDKLLYNSISHYFKKRPNISLRRIDRKDLSTLRKDGFIKTEIRDPTNKENNPEKTEDCKEDILAKKRVIITPEHLNKIKSKLKAVSYEKSKTKPPSTVKECNDEHNFCRTGSCGDEAPNIVEENQKTGVSEYLENHQPPVLIPERNSFEDDIESDDKDSPFVYLETKPDVEELNRMIQSLEPSKRSVNGQILDRKLSAMVEKDAEGSNCRQLEVFVCKHSRGEGISILNDCKDKVDFTLEREGDSEITSEKDSHDTESSNQSIPSKKKKSQAKLTSEVLVTKSDSNLTHSLFHSSISSTETNIDHSDFHSITDTNSSSNILGNDKSSTPSNVNLELNSTAKDPGRVQTSMDLESGSVESLDCSNEDILLENAAKEKDTSSDVRNLQTVQSKINKTIQSPHSIPSLPNVNSVLPKEPYEAACGYDSDETLVYDEEEEEGLCEKLARKKHRMYSRSSLVFSNCKAVDFIKDSNLTNSTCKTVDSEKVNNLKKATYKKINEHDSHKTHVKSLKTKKGISDREDSNGKKIKIKFPPKRKQKAKNDTESQDLLLTISPHKRQVGKRGHKQSGKMSSSCMKLLDIFNFEDSSEKQTMKTKKLLSPKCDEKVSRNRRSKNSKAQIKKKRALQSKTSYRGESMETKGYTVIDNVDEDDLPKILPPKRRRRNSKNDAAMKKKSVVVTDGMERLIQEFPRHNWLENKYKSEEIPRTHPEEIQTTEELYEYSLDEDKMDTTDLGEENQSTTGTVNPVVDEQDERSNQQNTFSLEASEMTSKSNTSDEQEDAPDEDRLQIVTDLDKDGQANEVMIPCTVSSAMTEVSSKSPDLNQDENSIVDIVADDQEKITEEPVESVVPTAQEEITEHPRTTTSTLPPVPHLIKAPDNNQDDMHSANPESFEIVNVNQSIAEQVCTSSSSDDSASVSLTESCSAPNIVDSVVLNKNCIASTMPSEGQTVNTRKRRYNGEESHERDRIYDEISTSDHINEKIPKMSTKVIDINNWKEIITAKVKNDINNQLQKTLTEFRELDQMVSEKAREAESLRQLREQKLRDLQSIQKNNSEAEIKRILNERLSMMERQPESKSEINSPPPAHQRPKQNIRELLDKMDRSHSQTPIDCSTFSAYSARKTPLHSPNASMSGKHSTIAHAYKQVSSIRNDEPNSETGIIHGHVPPAHETEQSSAIRASSAPVICNRSNFDKQSTISDVRLSVSRVNTVASNSRLCNGSKPVANTSRPNEAYIDLSQSTKDSEREIQMELNRALAVKRQKQDSSAKNDVFKSKEVMVNRLHYQNGEPFGARQTMQPSNPQPLLSAKSKEIRGYPHHAYTQQLVRPVSYVTVANSQTLNTERTVSSAYRQNIPGMMRPHAVRLLGATAVGNVQHTIDGRQAFTSNIPLNTFPNSGSIRQGTPIRQMQGIVSPPQPHVRPPLASGAASLENGQLIRHIPITAARTTDDTQKAPYVQQAAISSTGQPSMRPQGFFRPLAPVNSTKPHVGPLKTSNNAKIVPENPEFLLNPSQQHQQRINQQQQSNMPMNINGKCIVCSKFALYLCSNCQQFWYCSPQCQLKHWVSHQHHCKTVTNVS